MTNYQPREHARALGVEVVYMPWNQMTRYVPHLDAIIVTGGMNAARERSALAMQCTTIEFGIGVSEQIIRNAASLLLISTDELRTVIDLGGTPDEWAAKLGVTEETLTTRLALHRRKDQETT